MKRLVILLAVLLAVLIAAGWTQQVSAKPNYYDTFSRSWLDPTKWSRGLNCGSDTLECVREIQNGRLRLEIRNMGDPSVNSGFAYESNDLYFSDPSAISSSSITTDVTLGHVNVKHCPTNPAEQSKTIVKITGSSFNTGTGDPADDVWNDLYLWVDDSNPTTMLVGDWLGYLGIGADLGSYPIGTSLRLTNTWDKVNHQFISVAMIKGDPSSAKTVVVPYQLSDATPPANPVKLLTVMAYSPNCSSMLATTESEAFFDNVVTSPALPNKGKQ